MTEEGCVVDVTDSCVVAALSDWLGSFALVLFALCSHESRLQRRAPIIQQAPCERHLNGQLTPTSTLLETSRILQLLFRAQQLSTFCCRSHGSPPSLLHDEVGGEDIISPPSVVNDYNFLNTNRLHCCVADCQGKC